MKWIIPMILILYLTSCNNHEEQVQDAVTSLEWLESELDQIGERNISGYKRLLLIPGHEEINPNDTIKLSVKEFHDIQTEIFSIRNDLEQLSAELRKEYESE